MERETASLMLINAECAINRQHVQNLGGPNKISLAVVVGRPGCRNSTPEWSMWMGDGPALKIDQERAELIIADYDNEA
jgi:hypothetical protein